jgi:hypothetical protein
MLFLLVMEVLNGLFRKADAWSLLLELSPRQIQFRVSMYADDLALFFNPVQGDLQLATTIFDLFQGTSGLGCNMDKCQIMSIRCNDDQVALAQQLFPCLVTNLQIKYLGLPLSTGRVPKSAFQPLIDNMADKLPAWRGRLMHRSSRLSLIKSTLAAIPVYTPSSHSFPPLVIKAFTKIF